MLSTSRYTVITSKHRAQLIKQASLRPGLDPTRYSTHSVLGRWLLNAFEEYPVLSADGARGISSLMC
ncbi:hypothetical protein PC116_g2939 [Phytophthora cactorum]|uniref:Uncharacterized protein n=1 Tax=Phytophthora cactorum TaxID=29920 RepID=A0A8T1CIQ8_9STRA|nr:hypothetical protein PC111_g15613 [Phytophthora cactorum]KAG2811473.1 hypothetical protein PC112_g15586 [Phytophthora cactorum]KAG2851695.1 hypothetical protein PC113_g15682 [Phytophthora cactorum]KAG2890775.1 hypothetical protein PC114_g17291 [Phytophthora cactorum]KAG2903960.1 hypothetical protein PC115_g15141 [Phytophthora cactorum]